MGAIDEPTMKDFDALARPHYELPPAKAPSSARQRPQKPSPAKAPKLRATWRSTHSPIGRGFEVLTGRGFEALTGMALT